MKKFILIHIIILFSFGGFSQNYSNDWIDYSQKYYRIPITYEGVYRISYATLTTYGISAGDFDPRNIQIIHNGQTIPVFVSGESDWIFNNTDYFEFYASGGNTGILDTAIYMNSQPLNPDYSIYNDTASYFLTFANTLTSLRYDTARNTNFGAYSPLNYCKKTVRQNFASNYNATVTAPYLMPGEGWCDNFFNMGGSTSKVLSTPNYINAGIQNVFKFGFCGYSETRHDVFVECPTGTDIFDTIYTQYDAVHRTIPFSYNLTSSTSVSFRSVSGYNKTADKNCVAYVEITYPHSYNFESSNFFSFTIPTVPTGSFILLDITNFDGGDAPILYCPEINKRLVAKKNGSKYQVLVPNYYAETKCVLVAETAISTVPRIVNVKTKNTPTGGTSMFYNLESTLNQGDYIIITHSNLWTQANAYKTYRTSTGHQVVIIDVNELYNQFGYGIQKHPLAIHQFIKYASENWNITPENVFIIGKGYHLNLFRNDPTLWASTLVPAMGYPASDLLFTTDLHAHFINSSVAIGRLSAKTNTDVDNYRRKIIEHETQTPSPWMKTVLHFGGGNTVWEKTTFKAYLNSYKNILEGEYMGADVHTFLKESSDVFERTEPEAIREYMNAGTAFLNFFGHASGSGFDQNIDHPSLFNNQGKYPLILANSCYSGDIFTTSTNNISETWILIANKGSFGFLANVDLGRPGYLNIFTTEFLTNLSNTNYGNSVGSTIKLSLNNLQVWNYQEYKNAFMSFNYHGDPAVKVHSFSLPDLSISESSIFFNPSIITNDLLSFTTNVVINNLGKATTEDCSISLTYTSGSGQTFVYDTIVSGLFFKDTFAITLPMKYFESGMYTLSIEIDSDNVIPELNETNNTINIDFFISSRDVLPVFPQKYAIIPNNTSNLIASAIDPLYPPQSILFEIDTVADFSSPFKKSETIASNGNAIITWDPNITFIEHKVYFWRVSDADDIKWNESSFVYEDGKNGWAQKDPHQFIENDLEYLNFEEETDSYDFYTVPHDITAITIAGQTGGYYMIDGAQYGTSGASPYAMHIVVMDSTSLMPWYCNRDNYGHTNYPTLSGLLKGYFIFPTTDANYRNNMLKFLRDSVPVGNYILAYSWKEPSINLWEEELLQQFDSLGAKLHRVNPSNIHGYIFIGQKGDTLAAKELVSSTVGESMTLSNNAIGDYFQGKITSTEIGPSSHFQELVFESLTHNGETSTISIFGNSTENEMNEIESNISTNNNRLDTIIQAHLYPTINLDNVLYDNTLRTPPHLKSWKVYFDPVGELAVSPEYIFSISHDTIQQGNTITLNVSAQNISETDMDSVLIQYEIRNDKNELIANEYHRIAGVNAHQYITDVLNHSTLNLSGLYSIKIEYNPINPGTGVYDQLELEHFNNTLFANFYVITDKTKPILDVVFDGRHIINNDYVSPTPTITITLFDENQYLRLRDTSVFKITITNVTTGEIIPYYFSDSTLLFIAANENGNTCKAIFTPTFLENGQYILNVEAKDMSNNASGINIYTIGFTIELKQQISVLYNYPNPCKYFTTFRFILTGSELPKHMKIQIFANDGKILREIYVAHKQPIYIGTNSVDIYWDGCDNEGKLLANGIYTYRLVFSNSSEFSHLETDDDMYMSTKYGRMIIQK